MSKNMLKDFILPTAVLAVICLVISAALSVTYGITSPIIEENQRIAANNALHEVVPGADEFTEITEGLPEGAEGIYIAANGVGKAGKVVVSGYGGPISMMVGILSDGTIGGIKVLKSSETQGLGSRVMGAEYTSQFTGKTGADEVDAIAGSTISSDALKDGIRLAMEAISSVKE